MTSFHWPPSLLATNPFSKGAYLCGGDANEGHFDSITAHSCAVTPKVNPIWDSFTEHTSWTRHITHTELHSCLYTCLLRDSSNEQHTCLCVEYQNCFVVLEPFWWRTKNVSPLKSNSSEFTIKPEWCWAKFTEAHTHRKIVFSIFFLHFWSYSSNLSIALQLMWRIYRRRGENNGSNQSGRGRVIQTSLSSRTWTLKRLENTHPASGL